MSQTKYIVPEQIDGIALLSTTESKLRQKNKKELIDFAELVKSEVRKIARGGND